MTKQLRSAVVAAMSVVLAGLVLALKWSGLAIAAIVIVLMILVAAVSGIQARAALPAKPKVWARWIGRTEWLWIAIITGVSAAALYFAVQFGDKLDESIAGAAAFGAVAGVAFVKLLDHLSSESDWIDDKTQELARSTFQAAYMRQFDDAQPGGPVPSRHPEHPDQESDELFAVYQEERHGGWDLNGRKERAEDLASFISNNPGIYWV